MAHDTALAMVNEMYAQLATLARAVVAAGDDGKVSTFEGIQLGLKGTTLASTIAAIVQEADKATRQDVIHVLEHGRLVLPS